MSFNKTLFIEKNVIAFVVQSLNSIVRDFNLIDKYSFFMMEDEDKCYSIVWRTEHHGIFLVLLLGV